MPGSEVLEGKRPVTRSELVAGVRALGVRPGGVLMAHTRMSALGWVVGGAETVVRSLLDTLGSGGTLMAYAGWADDPYHWEEWPEGWRRAYREEFPPFDPAVSEAAKEMVGRIPERIRTWPGACRSRQPEASVVAVGLRAAWLTEDHPYDEAYGPGSPLAKLVEADGQVLLLGAPLETITLFHHAEAIADVPDKRRITYRMPILVHGRPQWREFHDIDTSKGAFAYEDVVPGSVDAFEVIAREVLAAGIGVSGRIGEAECNLFDAAGLVRFAVGWMELRFRPEG